MKSIRHYENIHIPLWLLKDTCWMLEWRILGVIMIVPTISVAIYIALKTWKEKSDEFWINLAICFWIAANAYWMCCEFFGHVELKNYAGFPFLVGMLCVSIFYLKRFKEKKEIV